MHKLIPLFSIMGIAPNLKKWRKKFRNMQGINKKQRDCQIHQPDIIILDYLLDGVDKTAMNGLETLDKIKASNPDIPVIILSAQDKIEVAVNGMHHKATDYVVKSETAFLRLQKIITNVMRFNKLEKELSWHMERM